MNRSPILWPSKVQTLWGINNRFQTWTSNKLKNSFLVRNQNEWEIPCNVQRNNQNGNHTTDVYCEHFSRKALSRCSKRNDFWISNEKYLSRYTYVRRYKQTENVQDIVVSSPLNLVLIWFFSPGSNLEYFPLLLDFKLMFSTRTALTSFFKISIPLKM